MQGNHIPRPGVRVASDASLQRAQLQHNAIGAAGLAALAAARADRGSAELSIALDGQRTPLTTGGGGVIMD